MDIDRLIDLIPAFVAALAGYAAARSSNKVNRDSSKDSNRIQMEKEAYDRARKHDVDTIERQDREMAEIRAELGTVKAESNVVLAENDRLRSKNKSLERKIDRLEIRIAVLEAALPEGHPDK